MNKFFIIIAALFIATSAFAQKWYTLMIDFALAGVLGVALYPYLGNRVWCRFACPLRAYMEIIAQKKAFIEYRSRWTLYRLWDMFSRMSDGQWRTEICIASRRPFQPQQRMHPMWDLYLCLPYERLIDRSVEGKKSRSSNGNMDILFWYCTHVSSMYWAHMLPCLIR